MERFVYSRRFAAALAALALAAGFALSAVEEAQARPAPAAAVSARG
jgi:hypothetical protein